MPKYLIERTVPGAGAMSAGQLAELAAASNAVLRQLGPDIQWVRSQVLADKLYCEYIARDEELIREHARCGGFPIDSVQRIEDTIDPATAEVGR